MENRGETYGGRTDRDRQREREIDSATFGRSFVQVALEHQSRIIPPPPLLHPPVTHPFIPRAVIRCTLPTLNPVPTWASISSNHPLQQTQNLQPPPRAFDWTCPSTLSPQIPFHPPPQTLTLSFTNPSAR